MSPCKQVLFYFTNHLNSLNYITLILTLQTGSRNMRRAVEQSTKASATSSVLVSNDEYQRNVAAYEMSIFNYQAKRSNIG